MLLLAVAAVAFGLYAGPRFSAAPFVAANVIVAIAIVAFGFSSGWTIGRMAAMTIVTIVCLQAAYLFGVVRKARTSRRVADQERAARQSIRNGNSTIDSPR